MSTFGEMFNNVPTSALMELMPQISDTPVKDDIAPLNTKMFNKMEAACVDLGCTFPKDLKTNISHIETLFDAYLLSKINKDTLRSAVNTAFNNMNTEIPTNTSMETTLNITLETTKEELGNHISQ